MCSELAQVHIYIMFKGWVEEVRLIEKKREETQQIRSCTL